MHLEHEVYSGGFQVKEAFLFQNVKGMTGDRGSFLGGGRSEMEKKVSKVPERVIEETVSSVLAPLSLGMTSYFRDLIIIIHVLLFFKQEHQNMILIDKYFQSLTLEGSEDSM